MNFRPKVHQLIVFSMVTFVIFICIHPFNGLAAGIDNKSEVDIVAAPSILFDIKDMAPGDIGKRTLTIKNGGKKDFNYITSVDLKSGSEKLFNNLLLTVSDNNGELYKGKLGNVNKLESRKLASLEKENLTFTLEFPLYLENEFQGLTCKVEFKFYVEGTLEGALPVDGPKLPETGTNTFNFLLAGGVLILTGSILQFIFKRRRNIEKRVKLDPDL